MLVRGPNLAFVAPDEHDKQRARHHIAAMRQQLRPAVATQDTRVDTGSGHEEDSGNAGPPDPQTLLLGVTDPSGTSAQRGFI